MAWQENKEGIRCHDHELAKKVHAMSMSKITLASSAEVSLWLINHPGPGESLNHFYNNDTVWRGWDCLGVKKCS
jgi:hypothetical protein